MIKDPSATLITRRSLLIGAASAALVKPAFGASLRSRGAGGAALPSGVSTIGNPSLGRTFATPEAWIAAAPTVIPYNAGNPQPYTGWMYNDALFTSTGIVIPNTIDTTAWNGSGLPAIVLTTGPGQSFRDNPVVRSTPLTYNPSNGVAININATLNGRAVSILIDNVALSNIQINCSNGNRVVNADMGASGGNIWFDAMIIAGNTMSVIVSSTGTIVTNTLLLQTANILTVDGSAAIFDGAVSVGGAIFRYVTEVQYSDTAKSDYDIWNTVGESGHPTVITNMALYGCTSIVQTGPGGVTATNCMSDVTGTLPAGITGGTTFTAQFRGTASTNADFRLASGSALRGAGTPIAGVTQDISGFPRPSSAPDVGCWQFS